MLKVVIDTNVFVSATITEKGKPAQILKAWREKKLEVIISPEILKEIGQVVFRHKKHCSPGFDDKVLTCTNFQLLT